MSEKSSFETNEDRSICQQTLRKCSTVGCGGLIKVAFQPPNCLRPKPLLV